MPKAALSKATAVGVPSGPCPGGAVRLSCQRAASQIGRIVTAEICLRRGVAGGGVEGLTRP